MTDTTTTDSSDRLTVNHMAEIKGVIKNESVITFHSPRARELLLRLVADHDRLREQVAVLEAQMSARSELLAEVERLRARVRELEAAMGGEGR